MSRVDDNDEPAEITALRRLAALEHTDTRLGVAFDSCPGRVIVGFAETIGWFTVSPEQARVLANALLTCAERAERKLN